MLRRKAPSHHHPCDKQKCTGASNDKQNFLSVTSRGQTLSKSKKSKKKTKRKNKTQELFREHWELLKEENKNLEKKLSTKKKKIDQLKLRIKMYEAELKTYHQKQECWKIESQKHKNSIFQEEGERKMTEMRMNRMMEDSQAVAKEALHRYKLLEEEFASYKETTQKKISKLKKEHKKTSHESVERVYGKEIQDLRKQIHKFKQDQATMSSLKNLHSHSKQEHKDEIKHLKMTIHQLKTQNQKLSLYNREIEDELNSYKQSVSHKEIELKNNLDIINKKVLNWQKQYRQVKQECKEWQEQYNLLWNKYERKKLKTKRNNEEWAQIFKEFIQEIDRLKKELEMVSERNLKLIKMCQIK